VVRRRNLIRVILSLGLSLGATTVLTCAPAAAAPPYGNNAAAGHTFVFNGNRFYYESYGNGAPLLLIHGNGESIKIFKGQIGAFSRRYRVIAMDSRGQGKSELGTTALSYAQMSEDTNALLDHLMLAHVRVLGWSDGGIIGLLLAIHHPDKVGMLAVMGANLQPDAAYSWAVDGVARLRKRVTSELATSHDPKRLQRQLQLLDLLGNQPHIPVSDLATIQAPTLVMAADRDVIRDEHTHSAYSMPFRSRSWRSSPALRT